MDDIAIELLDTFCIDRIMFDQDCMSEVCCFIVYLYQSMLTLKQRTYRYHIDV